VKGRPQAAVRGRLVVLGNHLAHLLKLPDPSFRMKSLAALVLTGLATASPAAVGAHPKMHGGRRSALYFQDNNPDGTTIISLNIDLETGLLSNPVRTPTGGNGLLAIKNGTNPPTGKLCYSSSPCQPLCEQASMPRCKSSSDVIVADTTFSQDIVFASDTSIFTANTGSGTISHMVIDPSDPQHPKAAGAPGLVEGGFPNSVAYSPRHELLCAVSSGAGASVTCFGPGPDGGLERRGAAIRLPVIQQTTPPHGPDGTASDIVFNPAQTAAFVTVKSNTTAAPGFIYVFPVAPAAGGRAAALAGDRAVVSRPPELNHDFSLTFLSDARAVISDTTFGAALLHIAPDLSVTTEVATRIPGAKAACWTVYAPEFEAIYVMDGANPNVTVLDPQTGAIRYQLDGPLDGVGAFDAVRGVGGRFLYVLLGKAGVAVWDLAGSRGSQGKKPKLVQSLDLSALGSRQGWQGLVVYPN